MRMERSDSKDQTERIDRSNRQLNRQKEQTERIGRKNSQKE